MRFPFLRGALTGGAAVLLLAGSGAAQSLLSTQGIGFVLEPADARGRALGGVLMGLPGPSLSPANPAEALTTSFISIAVSFQQDEFTSRWEGEESSHGAARFPFVYSAFPVGRNAALSIGFTSFLDQNWRVRGEDTLTLGGEPVAIVDHVLSTGGVSQLRLGGAYRFGGNLLAGVSLNLHTGSNERVQRRQFAAGGGHPAAISAARWNYSGLSGTLGARWTPHEAAVLSTSITLGGSLTGTPSDEVGESRSYDLPLEAAGGASVRVAPTVVLAAGGNYRGWSSLDDGLAEIGGARDTWTFGGGIELDPGTTTGRAIPLRLGARTSALPFRPGDASAGDGWLRESAVTAGAGLRVAAGLARVDAGVERGTRGGAGTGLEESFWRFSLSAVISGR